MSGSNIELNAFRRYLFRKLMLVSTKELNGVRRYLFKKLMLVYTKRTYWYQAVFI